MEVRCSDVWTRPFLWKALAGIPKANPRAFGPRRQWPRSHPSPICGHTLHLVVFFLAASLVPEQLHGQDFQGPAGANYAGVGTNFGVSGANISIGVIEHPLLDPIRTGIIANNHLGTNLVEQWDFGGRMPPVWGPGGPPPFAVATVSCEAPGA